jgi:predicted glutamine amidotransferase
MVKVPDPDTTVVYIASVPLTEEGWSPLPEGTVLALREGTEVARMEPGQ